MDKGENSGCGSLSYPKHPCCDHKSAATLTGTRQALNILNAGVLGSSILCLSHFFNNLSFLVPVKAKDARMSLFHLGYHR